MPSMSRRSSKKNSSSGLRQTTLFDNLPSLSAPEKWRGSRVHDFPSSSPSKKRTDWEEDSSDDEIAAIMFAPTEAAIPASEFGGDSSLKTKTLLKGKARLVLTPSPSQSEEERSPHLKAGQDLSSGGDDNDPPKKTRRLRRRKQLEITASSEENIAHLAGEPPRKRRRLRRRKSSEIVASSEEDLAHLVDEVEEERILETRLRTREKSRFQKNLEKLKKHKLKLQDENNDSERDTEHQSEEIRITPRHFKGSKPSNEFKNDVDDTDDNELSSASSSDFIVEDDDTVQLPPEFSMETHQDLSHQFKKIFQFFVHIAVQPPKKRAAYMQMQIRDEQYFSVPLQVTRRKLSGLRDSLVSSSVWRPEFKSSLEKYPEFELTRLDFAVPSCDACHLGGRLSTLMGRLNGTYYNPYGFEPKRPKNKDEQSGEEFHLGRFCAKRTRVFHEFSHWEYALFQGILREINELHASVASTGFHRVAYGGGRKPPTDLEDADGLCDWLDKRKIIDMEWQKMKSMMESARHLEMEKDHMAD